MKFNSRQLRQKLGMTQTEVANVLGMTLGNYQRYEYGKVLVYPLDVIEKFCLVFDCEPNDLFVFEKKQERQTA